MKKKIILLVVISILAGMAIGFFGGSYLHRKRFERFAKGDMPTNLRSNISDKLDLTEDQKVPFDSIFQNHMQKMNVIKESNRKEARSEMEAFFGSVETILDANQLQKLDEMKSRMIRKKSNKNEKRGNKRRQ
ncbi:MAG: hypothetical protein ACI8ZN_002466 [Bacteroidia bacterium]|jgi:hypothetical protein